MVLYNEETRIKDPIEVSCNYSDALDALGLKRYCCRRMLLSHVDLIEKLLNYAPLEKAAWAFLLTLIPLYIAVWYMVFVLNILIFTVTWTMYFYTADGHANCFNNFLCLYIRSITSLGKVISHHLVTAFPSQVQVHTGARQNGEMD